MKLRLFLAALAYVALPSIAAAQSQGESSSLWPRIMSGIGLLGFVFVAWLFSTERKRLPWRIAAWGLCIQLVFGFLTLKTTQGAWLFRILNDTVTTSLDIINSGSQILFGDISSLLAIKIACTIIVFSSLMALFYHLRVMQFFIRFIAKAMQKTMGTSGAETMSASANIFVGQTEAPLVIAPFVKDMTRSELNAVMVGGFATVAGSVLGIYVGMLKDYFPNIAGHLIAASVISAPAALVIAKVMVPETEEPETLTTIPDVPKIDANSVDAIARGAKDGLFLALNVVAMLLAFLGVVALLNATLGISAQYIYDWLDVPTASRIDLSLEWILGKVFWPFAYMMGVEAKDCSFVASLLGEKLILTEFVAYTHLGEALKQGSVALSERSIAIATYALCGFANVGSIGIQIGGIGSLAPERRGDLAKLGVRAMFGGAIAACMTACIAGLLM